MKKLALLAVFLLTTMLSAENGQTVTYDVVSSDVETMRAAAGAGMEMRMGMGEYSAVDMYGDHESYMDLYMSIPIYFQADLKFSEMLSYIGQARVDAFYMYMPADSYDTEMTIFRNLSLQNYLLVHLSDKTETKNTQVTVSSTYAGSDYYYNYYNVIYITVPIPMREIIALRFGKPISYTVGSPFNFSPFSKLSAGIEYASYQDAVIDTDLYGTIFIHDVYRFYADLFVNNPNFIADGALDNIGIYGGMQMAFSGFDMQMNMSLAGFNNGTISKIDWYYDFLFGIPFIL